MKRAYLIALAPALAATGAMAQDAPPAAAPAPNAQAAAPISDEEVSRFAMAALLVQQIAADQSLDQQQKQSAMNDAVAQTGLEPQRFNEIAQRGQGNPELQERIELAANAHIERAQQAQQNQ